MKKQHCSERVSPISCLHTLIEAAQQREWRNAQERKRVGAGRFTSPVGERARSERHTLSN